VVLSWLLLVPRRREGVEVLKYKKRRGVGRSSAQIVFFFLKNIFNINIF